MNDNREKAIDDCILFNENAILIELNEMESETTAGIIIPERIRKEHQKSEVTAIILKVSDMPIVDDERLEYRRSMLKPGMQVTFAMNQPISAGVEDCPEIQIIHIDDIIRIGKGRQK